MERYLITQTLLSSWAYVFNCWEGTEEDAMSDFLRTLKREPSEPTDAMLEGIEFENEVYAAASEKKREPHTKWESGIQLVATFLRGAQTQVKAQRDIRVHGMDFLVYGILDGLRAGVIFDVKKKSKGFGSLELAGGYLESAQHPAYFYIVPEAYEFQYLVSDGQDLYVEKYRPEECRPISEIIEEFIISIEAMGLLPLYKEKWAAK
jgi:hypothetical protein